MATTETTPPPNLTNMVLIDDDSTYCSIMRRYAKKDGIELDTYPSIMEISAGSNELLGRYEAAIIDFDLGEVNGVEIISYLSSIFGDIPMILVSGSERSDSNCKWPELIKSFKLKSTGYQEILHEARRIA